MSAAQPAPVVGSVWEDRQDGRRVTVEAVDAAFAHVRHIRRSRVRLPLTRRYRHVYDPAEEADRG